MTNLSTRSNQANREYWLKKTLRKIPSGKKILDAGAGELKYKKFCKHLKYTSQDFGEYDPHNNTEGLQANSWNNSLIDIKSDITNIPVKDNSYDSILCVEVLEHIPEPIKAIKEFVRILKPNGVLILTAPFCSLTHMAPYYFYNGYSKYWYEKILDEHGFEIKEISYNGNYFSYLIQELRRLPSVEKKYSQTKFTKSLFYRLSVKYLVKILVFLSKKSKNSEEFLCFGLHVLAVKR